MSRKSLRHGIRVRCDYRERTDADCTFKSLRSATSRFFQREMLPLYGFGMAYQGARHIRHLLLARRILDKQRHRKALLQRLDAPRDGVSFTQSKRAAPANVAAR